MKHNNNTLISYSKLGLIGLMAIVFSIGCADTERDRKLKELIDRDIVAMSDDKMFGLTEVGDTLYIEGASSCEEFVKQITSAGKTVPANSNDALTTTNEINPADAGTPDTNKDVAVESEHKELTLWEKTKLYTGAAWDWLWGSSEAEEGQNTTALEDEENNSSDEISPDNKNKNENGRLSFDQAVECLVEMREVGDRKNLIRLIRLVKDKMNFEQGKITMSLDDCKNRPQQSRYGIDDPCRIMSENYTNIALAYYYQADYLEPDNHKKRALFEEGRKNGVTATDYIKNSPAGYFVTATNWAVWMATTDEISRNDAERLSYGLNLDLPKNILSLYTKAMETERNLTSKYRNGAIPLCLGWYHYKAKNNLPGGDENIAHADRYIQQALEINPNDSSNHHEFEWYAFQFYRDTSRPNRAKPYAEWLYEKSQDEDFRAQYPVSAPIYEREAKELLKSIGVEVK